MGQISFKHVEKKEDILELCNMAKVIWNEHFVPIIGQEQVNYMIKQFQSPYAIEKQIQDGYFYFRLFLDGSMIGYTGSST